MKWNENAIAGMLARQLFNRRALVVVPNCKWTGHECDLLVVTSNLRVVDIEIKISRSDLKADAAKDKWWHRNWLHRNIPNVANRWPPRVWKHYYAMPADVWDDSLFTALPSSASGVLLLAERDGMLIYDVKRRAMPDRSATQIPVEVAVDIARLASLRMWDALARMRAADQQIEVLTTAARINRKARRVGHPPTV